MDHSEILNLVRSKDNLERCFCFALQDRLQSDYYFDYFEIDYARKNKDLIIQSLLEELQHQDKYITRPAYAFYPPKTDLCYRRMVYIPFKDLVVRYAFVNILAEILDNELSPRCFANRKAKGGQADKTFLEDFSILSWPNFCNWQKICAGKYPVLLRTDISAFYDSVSHSYLALSIARELGVQEETELIRLFRKILGVSVISYSHLKREPLPQREMLHGLAIGNTTDGFLANLYLKDVDDEINKIEGIEFGRYNDDMRIFGKDRETVLAAVLALQELLLTKGLNLNSSKTCIAENEQEVEELRSKRYEAYSYHVEEIEVVEEHVREVNNVQGEIDEQFDEFSHAFSENDALTSNGDAKDYCKFISSRQMLPLAQRAPHHIRLLEEILKKWRGSGKHAAWLIVQSAFWKDIPAETQNLAKQTLIRMLSDDDIDSYSKYRLLHHLIKRREGKQALYEQLTDQEKQEIIAVIPDFIRQPAFELNIIGLYLLHFVGKSFGELKDYVSKYAPKPLGEPIKKALSYIQYPQPVREPVEEIDEFEQESDEIPQPY